MTEREFAALHPLRVDEYGFDSMTYQTGPYAPHRKSGGTYGTQGWPYLTPVSYTDWRDETEAWQRTCVLNAHLNPSPLVIIRGPDAKQFLSDFFVNNIDDFPIGLVKHGVMCIENGLVASHGVLMHTGKNEYQTYWNSPYLEYCFSKKSYEAELIDVTDKTYVFQLQGPKSLEVLEELTQDDLHDIAFRHYRNSQIDGQQVRIMRLSMSGSLGYEIHGELAHAKEVYQKLLIIGNRYGMRLMGEMAYCMTFTHACISQIGSFTSAMFLDEGFNRWKAEQMGDAESHGSDMDAVAALGGSVGDNIQKHLFNPYEIGFGHCVNLKHEFQGKAALVEYRKDWKRDLITLEWNSDDIVEIYASQFSKGEESYPPMEWPGGGGTISGNWKEYMHYVYDKDGKEIGLSTNYTYSYYYRNVLSLASLDRAYQAIGTEVFVLWGEPGTRQKLIRAKVVCEPRRPYHTHMSNAAFDVESIPRPGVCLESDDHGRKE